MRKIRRALTAQGGMADVFTSHCVGPGAVAETTVARAKMAAGVRNFIAALLADFGATITGSKCCNCG